MLKLEQMTPEQKIGRILCFRRFDLEDDIQFTEEMIRKQACGAVQVLFNDKTEELIKRFRDAADYPLLVVADMERGVPLSNIPSTPLLNLSAANNLEYARAFAAHTASEAKKLGYSGCWGPVLDILRVSAPGYVSRVAADNPEQTLRITEEIFKTFASYNFQATGKHYPGGMDCEKDTHMVGAYSDVTEEELLNFDLVPYLELMKKGLLPAIMTDHSIYKNIDPERPASLSKRVIDIIRSRGYDGVLYTDSLAMMGILQTFGEKRAHSMALMAGNDIVLPNYRTPTREIYEMMLDEYRNGYITDERLDEAVRRVMKLEQYCATEPTNPVEPPKDIVKVMTDAARDSITAECDEGVSAAIDNPEKPRLFIAVIPQNQSAEVIGAEISDDVRYNSATIFNEIKKNFPNAEVEFIHEYPTAMENERVLVAATKYDEVVWVTSCTSGAYAGTDCMTRRLESVINALVMSGKVKALLHYGNPLALGYVYHIPRMILMYSAPAAIPCAFEILAGKYQAKGTNPFKNATKKYRNLANG